MNVLEFPDILQNIAQQFKHSCLRWMSFNKVAREIASRVCRCRMRFTIETLDEHKKFPNVEIYCPFKEASFDIVPVIVQILNMPRKITISLPKKNGSSVFCGGLEKFINLGGDISKVRVNVKISNLLRVMIVGGKVFDCSRVLAPLGNILKQFKWELFVANNDVTGINSEEIALVKRTITGVISECTKRVWIFPGVRNIDNVQPHINVLKIEGNRYNLIDRFPNITELILVVHTVHSYQTCLENIDSFEKVGFSNKSVIILRKGKCSIEEARNYFGLRELPNYVN